MNTLENFLENSGYNPDKDYKSDYVARWTKVMGSTSIEVLHDRRGLSLTDNFVHTAKPNESKLTLPQIIERAEKPPMRPDLTYKFDDWTSGLHVVRQPTQLRY